MRDALVEMEEVRETLEAIKEKQVAIEKGHERLRHYQDGTTSLRQAIATIAALADGQDAANDVYERELGSLEDGIKKEISDAQNSMELIVEAMAERRNREDAFAQSIMQQMGAGAVPPPDEDPEVDDAVDESSDDE